MSNPWFRLYSEFANDPKVQMMSEVMQRRYIMLMCLRCSNTLVTLHETEVAFQLRITDSEMAETKALFIKKGFIDSEWNLLNWDKRQFASDTSKARVAKHRALQKEQQKVPCNADVTLQKRNDNALDTDTDTDTDTEHKTGSDEPVRTVPEKQKQEPTGFANFWKTWPSNDRKQGKGKCLDAWKKAKAETDWPAITAHVEALKSSRDWQKNNGEFVPSPLVYLNQRRWDGAESAQALATKNQWAGAV